MDTYKYELGPWRMNKDKKLQKTDRFKYALLTMLVFSKAHTYICYLYSHTIACES